MKIVHMCLCGTYNDGWSYQDNIIPKYNKLDNHDVTIIASRYIDNRESKGIDKVKAGVYFDDNNIKIIRLNDQLKNQKLNKKIRKFEDVYDVLSSEEPDLIFFHGVQSIEMLTVKKYIKRNKDCLWIVDNHASYFNSASNFLSRNILHKLLYKLLNDMCKNYINTYFAVTPHCKKFLNEVYKISDENIKMLYLGYDDELFESIPLNNRNSIRSKYDIHDEDFVFITGGKLNKNKKIIELMMVFSNITNENVKLLIFGTLSDDISNKVKELASKDSRIIYVGWKNQKEISELLLLSDVGIYIGSQSVLWQQSIGAGLPLILSIQENVDYLNVNNNVLFVDRGNPREILNMMRNIISDDQLVKQLRINTKQAKQYFSYRNISRRVTNYNEYSEK